MGETIKSYRLALDDEIRRWDGFAKALLNKDREAFNALMDAGRSYVYACNNNVQPIIFEPLVMSILLSQQIRLQRLRKELDAIKNTGTSRPC
jgi:hypothetical protein